MAAAFLALLAQGAPSIETRKALLLTGVQNDFLSPDGKLPVNTSTGFLDRLRELVPDFREHGDVIWVRSEFQDTREVNNHETVTDHVIAGSVAQDHASDRSEESDDFPGPPSPSKRARLCRKTTDRPVSIEESDRIGPGHVGLTEPQDEDEELFLTETSTKKPCCLPGSYGAEYAAQIKDLVDPTDIEVTKTYYSAFGSTSLLLTLRSRLVTELFICGCITNLSVFATAMDAARYGIKVTLVEDCLGYRRKDRHEQAMKQLHDIMEADIRSSTDVIDRLKNASRAKVDGVGKIERRDTHDDVKVGEEAGDLSVVALEAGSTDEDHGDEDAPTLGLPLNVENLRALQLQTQATRQVLAATKQALKQARVDEVQRAETISSAGSIIQPAAKA